MIGYIYRVSPNGSELEDITPPDFEGIRDAYQADNGDIFVSGKIGDEKDFTIYNFASVTRQVNMLVDLEGSDQGLRPSPDGKWLLFRIESTSYRVHTDGTQLVSLPNCTGYSWSPDSQYLTCTYMRNGIGYLSLLNIETLEITLIKQFDTQVYGLNWSPDGEWIILKFENYPQLDDIYKIRRDGSELTRLTYTNFYDEENPSWSPDGNWIAFIRHYDYRDGYSLYKMRPDGSNEKWLGDLEYISAPILWSPIIDYSWHDKILFGTGFILILLSLSPIKKSLFRAWNKLSRKSQVTHIY